MKKKQGFTLLEVIIAITSFFLLLVAITNIYARMIKIKNNTQARTNITQDTYFVIEKINLLLKDYTIDYEEYFNRKNVWCDDTNTPFTRNVWSNGYCDNFSSYGNNNKLYYCSSTTNENSPQIVIEDENIQNGSGCITSGYQAFGQYAWHFRDTKNDVDGVNGAKNDDDDEKIMKGPNAIDDQNQTQELYLIAQDGKSRIFIRRALINSGDRNNDGIISGDSEKLYTLQILKLRGFDAGTNHNFDTSNSSGVYDGKVDTRACDYAQWFICQWTGIWSSYTNYNLPLNTNDGRVNLFQNNITISDRNLIIYPSKNPQYALAEPSSQINPYFSINLTSKLYGKIRQKRLGIQNIDDFQLNLQTTFNTKNFYTK